MTVQEDGLLHAALHHSREPPVVQPLNLDIVCKEKAHPHCHSKPHSHATFITKSQRKGPLEKQLLGCGSFWRNSRCTPSFADNSLLLPAVSKEQGEHARPDMGREGEGGRCLLTGDDVGGRLEVLQPQHPDVQLEDRSSDRHRHFFAVELLLDRSKEPESRDQDSLHREKTERLTRVYFRGGKSHEHQEQGVTALRPPRSQVEILCSTITVVYSASGTRTCHVSHTRNSAQQSLRGGRKRQSAPHRARHASPCPLSAGAHKNVGQCWLSHKHVIARSLQADEMPAGTVEAGGMQQTLGRDAAEGFLSTSGIRGHTWKCSAAIRAGLLSFRTTVLPSATCRHSSAKKPHTHTSEKSTRQGDLFHLQGAEVLAQAAHRRCARPVPRGVPVQPGWHPGQPDLEPELAVGRSRRLELGDL